MVSMAVKKEKDIPKLNDLIEFLKNHSWTLFKSKAVQSSKKLSSARTSVFISHSTSVFYYEKDNL